MGTPCSKKSNEKNVLKQSIGRKQKYVPVRQTINKSLNDINGYCFQMLGMEFCGQTNTSNIKVRINAVYILRMCICPFVCMCTYVYMSFCMYVYVCVCPFVCMCTFMYVAHACMYLCAYVRVRVRASSILRLL